VDEEAEAGGIVVRNGQERVTLRAGFVRELARGAAAVVALIRRRGLALQEPPAEVAVVLMDDRGMAAVHGEYFGENTPTDVISFPLGESGEILIGVETGRRQAEELGTTLEAELGLYLTHGLLHLCGHEDESADGRDRMGALQEELRREAGFEG